MPTLKEIADKCGVSKPTVKKKLRELEMFDGHVRQKGQTFIVSDEAASAVSDALGVKTRKGDATPPADTSVIDLYERHIAALEADKARLERKVDAKDAEIADLTRKLAELAATGGRRSIWDRLLPGRAKS